MNWHTVGRNWGFIGGLLFGLIFVAIGVSAYILRREFHGWLWDWVVGLIFLGLAALKGWNSEP
jgi:thiamine transporter ThiT